LSEAATCGGSSTTVLPGQSNSKRKYKAVVEAAVAANHKTSWLQTTKQKQSAGKFQNRFLI